MSATDEFGRQIVSCGLCGKPTPMTGTQRCDGCWELETRVRADPELARRILSKLDALATAPKMMRVQVAYRQGVVRTYLAPAVMPVREFAERVARFGKVASIRGLREVKTLEDFSGALDLRAAPGRRGEQL